MQWFDFHDLFSLLFGVVAGEAASVVFVVDSEVEALDELSVEADALAGLELEYPSLYQPEPLSMKPAALINLRTLPPHSGHV
jgi:hypothetical protein